MPGTWWGFEREPFGPDWGLRFCDLADHWICWLKTKVSGWRPAQVVTSGGTKRKNLLIDTSRLRSGHIFSGLNRHWMVEVFL
jgi:hypothetical protein